VVGTYYDTVYYCVCYAVFLFLCVVNTSFVRLFPHEQKVFNNLSVVIA
jgi:hypothetical protein